MTTIRSIPTSPRNAYVGQRRSSDLAVLTNLEVLDSSTYRLTWSTGEQHLAGPYSILSLQLAR